MKAAVITGASSGLGVQFLDAVEERYPDLDEIWILARRKERLDKLTEKYPNSTIIPIAADLANDAEYQKLKKLLADRNPDIKVLINNAGYEKSWQFSEMAEDAIIDMINVNIKGMTMIQRLCMPYMRRGSYTVMTCSVSAFVPIPHQAVYSASKKYVYFLGKALREEARKKGVNILLLCPGNMNTEMNPQGQGRQSRKTNGLPFLDMKTMTRVTLSKAERGKSVYTMGSVYKLFHLGACLAPPLMTKIAAKFY